MNTTNEIEQTLNRLSEKFSADDTMVDDVMRRVDQRLVAPRRWMTWRATAMAACLAAVLVGVWAILPSNGLHARAIAALENARTIVAVSHRWQNGGWVPTADIVYERGVGVYERQDDRGIARVRIDDGTNEWQYSSDSPTVRKSPTRDTLGVVRQILREGVRESAKTIDTAKHDRAGDREIDGVPCRHYALDRETLRYRIWIDDRDRIRRFEEQTLRDGQWQNDELSEVKYDVPVDRNVFVPQLPANARIIEAQKTLEASFFLGNAKYKQETDGLTFAVHRVERLVNGWFFVVSSLRPTEATRAEIGNNGSGPAARNYASLQMGTSFKRFKNDPNKMRQYVPFTLAEAYHDGTEVQWTLFEPVGPWEIDPKTFEVSWRFTADGKLAEKLQAQGRPMWAEHKSVAQLKAESRKATVTDIAGETYEALEVLETVAAIAKLELKSIPFTDQEMQEYLKHNPRHPRLLHGRAEPPSKVTREQFLAELEARLAESAAQRR